jgi:hemoglobin
MRTLAIAVFVLSLGACAESSSETKTTPPPTGAQKSLYERLGGKDAITAVVGLFLTKVGADARINARFANADMPRLKQMLVDQICQASGGPCQYTGKDMKTAHTGMNVTEDEFNALVQDLQAALADAKVPAPEQKDLIGALAPMKGDIVGH